MYHMWHTQYLDVPACMFAGAWSGFCYRGAGGFFSTAVPADCCTGFTNLLLEQVPVKENIAPAVYYNSVMISNSWYLCNLNLIGFSVLDRSQAQLSLFLNSLGLLACLACIWRRDKGWNFTHPYYTHGVSTVVMKNWQPLVFWPALAYASTRNSRHRILDRKWTSDPCRFGPGYLHLGPWTCMNCLGGFGYSNLLLWEI